MEMLCWRKEVVGIIPAKTVDREVAHRGCYGIVIVRNNAGAPKMAYWLSREMGFIAMPVGIAPWRSFFENMTLNQLHYIQKPLGIYNCKWLLPTS